ncbi:hypothetical protein DFH05DRAFT_1373389, partial [Lentinula detonsa]
LAGVPAPIVEWMGRRYARRETRLTFDDYTTDLFSPPGGLDQGDAFAVVQYLFYNSGLLKLIRDKADEMGILFMDDSTLVVWAYSFLDTHHRLAQLMNDPGGVLNWARLHNCTFGLDKFQL